MSEALEKLKDIGAQKIYEDTHIPVEHVQSILYESFEGLNKLQFLGFVSILEREYGTDLGTLREKGIVYFDEKNTGNDLVKNEAIYKAPSNKRNLTIIYIVIAILIFVIAIIYTMDSASDTLQNVKIQKNQTIDNVKETIIQEINDTQSQDENDTNQTLVLTPEENLSQSDVQIDEALVAPTPKKQEVKKAITHSLKIVPKTRVWLGYIDVKTNKKYQKTFKGSLKLNSKKEWLLYFGHGYVTILIDGEKITYSNKDTLRLHYKDGKVSKISSEEFRRLNRGSKW